MGNRELTPKQIDVLRQCKYELARFFRQMREAHGLTQQEASFRAQLDNKTFGRVERGEVTPTFETLILFAGVFELSPAEFLHRLADALAGIEARQGRECVVRHRIGKSDYVLEIWQEGRDK